MGALMYLWWEEQPQTQFLSLVNTKHVTKAAALVRINLVSILLEIQRLLLVPYAKPELLKNRMLIYKENQTPVFHKYFFLLWTSHRCIYCFSLNGTQEPTLALLQSLSGSLQALNHCSINSRLLCKSAITNTKTCRVKVQFPRSPL